MVYNDKFFKKNATIIGCKSRQIIEQAKPWQNHLPVARVALRPEKFGATLPKICECKTVKSNRHKVGRVDTRPAGAKDRIERSQESGAS
jgi:hypothetical protein